MNRYEATDLLMGMARQRATTGKRPSDTLLIFLIKAKCPEYRDNVRVNAHGAGGGEPDGEAPAETVSEPARDAGNGTGRILAHARSLRLDRELAGRGAKALPPGDGRSLPPRGTESGTVPGGIGLTGAESGDCRRAEKPGLDAGFRTIHECT